MTAPAATAAVPAHFTFFARAVITRKTRKAASMTEKFRRFHLPVSILFV